MYCYITGIGSIGNDAYLVILKLLGKICGKVSIAEDNLPGCVNGFNGDGSKDIIFKNMSMLRATLNELEAQSIQ